MKLNNNSNDDEFLDKNETKKFSIPIIPIIKTSFLANQYDHEQKNKENNSLQTSPLPKTYQSQSILNSNSLRKLLNQPDLEKMTKKQLAQTYYGQFLKLNRQNQVLDNQLAFVRQQRDNLFKKYCQLKVKQQNNDEFKQKRQRRVATEIQRSFHCPLQNCQKSYGSEGSLMQHIKIKHELSFSSEQYQSLLNRNQKKDCRSKG